MGIRWKRHQSVWESRPGPEEKGRVSNKALRWRHQAILVRKKERRMSQPTLVDRVDRQGKENKEEHFKRLPEIKMRSKRRGG